MPNPSQPSIIIMRSLMLITNNMLNTNNTVVKENKNVLVFEDM